MPLAIGIGIGLDMSGDAAVAAAGGGADPIDPRTVADGGIDYLATRFASGNNSQSFKDKYGVFGEANNGGFLQLVGVGGHGRQVGDWIGMQAQNSGGFAVASTVRSVEDSEIFTSNWAYDVGLTDGEWYYSPPSSEDAVSLICPAVGERYFYDGGAAVWTTGTGFTSGAGMTAWDRDSAEQFTVQSLFAVVNVGAGPGDMATVAGVTGADADMLWIGTGGGLVVQAEGNFDFPTSPGSGKKLVAIRLLSGQVWQVRYTGSGGWLTTTMDQGSYFNISHLLAGGENLTTAPSGVMAVWWDEGDDWDDATFDGLAAFYQAQADVAVGW